MDGGLLLTTTEVNEIHRMSGMESQINEDGFLKLKVNYLMIIQEKN